MDWSVDIDDSPAKILKSENFYWLRISLAVSYAALELEHSSRKFPELFEKPVKAKGSAFFISHFQKSLKDEKFLVENIETVKKATIEEMKKITDFISRSCYLFSPKKGLILGKVYSHYYYIYKLLKFNTQRLLNLKAKEESCLLLNLVKKDFLELAEIEEKLIRNEGLSRDEVIYLYSHFQRDRLQIKEIAMDLYLLQRGFIEYDNLCGK